jgi:hypothetical protein
MLVRELGGDGSDGGDEGAALVGVEITGEVVGAGTILG